MFHICVRVKISTMQWTGLTKRDGCFNISVPLNPVNTHCFSHIIFCVVNHSSFVSTIFIVWNYVDHILCYKFSIMAVAYFLRFTYTFSSFTEETHASLFELSSISCKQPTTCFCLFFQPTTILFWMRTPYLAEGR